MEGLETVFQHILYAEFLFGFILVMTTLFLCTLFNVKHIQTTIVEFLMTIGTIIVMFGIPYIIIQSSFLIGMLIIAGISIILSSLLFFVSIETSN